MNLCEYRPPHAVQLQNEAISPLKDVAGASVARQETICSQSNRLLNGAVSSAANRQSGANKRSLNKKSLRTLKRNEAQGAAITVCVYYRQNNTKSKTIHQTRRAESFWRQTWALSVISDGIGFWSHHNNVQSCCKLHIGRNRKTLSLLSHFSTEMRTLETISQAHNQEVLCATRHLSWIIVFFFFSTSFHWLVWN